MPKRLGFIGTGKIACHHAAAAVELGHHVVASCGKKAMPRPTAWQSAFSDAAHDYTRCAPDIPTILADTDLDAIIVCLPWNVIPEWYPRLLRSPIPMLIEKPVALSAAQAKTALDQPDLHLDNKLIGYNRRFYGTVGVLRERLSENGLVAVQVIMPIKANEKSLDEALVFQSHMPDLLLHLFGPLSVVRLFTKREYSLNGLLVTESDIPVSLAMSNHEASPASIRCVFGDGTTWHLAPLERLTVYAESTKAENDTIAQYTPNIIETINNNTDIKPGFYAQMLNFLSGDFHVGATPQSCVATHEFIDMLYAEMT